MRKYHRTLNTLPPLEIMVRWREQGLSPEAVLERARNWIKPQQSKRVVKAQRQLKPIGCPDCELKPFGRGLCYLCYMRARYRGTIEQYAKARRGRKPGTKITAGYTTAIGCDDCRTSPHARGLCKRCYIKALRRGVLGEYPLVNSNE